MRITFKVLRERIAYLQNLIPGIEITANALGYKITIENGSINFSGYGNYRCARWTYCQEIQACK